MEPDQKIVYSLVKGIVETTPKDERRVGFLTDALGIKPREVFSLVGAGGKTTLMFRLAKELSLGGKKIVTTTTTKILEPTPEETGALFIEPDEEKVKNFVKAYQSPEVEQAALEAFQGGAIKGW